ncbi:GntR family transcriptional regulator [Amaricoccus sp.]|uniref:GntR family transcriptional regulator n=1 Tax=Amaricoccus sp. TaxID=1872485 RepID=UPI001B5A3AD0|nr:GntR family transcriptional regulator [Amaricoccus sp.]MBP6999978.1 GntR family transcriptional regulator [Amaricoccus sp.]
MSGASLTQAVRAQLALREGILAGEFPAGTRLLEVPLAERLAISRTPIRDALARLAEEGLLERVRGGGFVVRTFGLGDVVDAIELRGVLEGTAARLAAERGVAPARLAELARIVDALDAGFARWGGEVDMADYGELNARFHAVLWELSGSPIVQREIERVARLPFGSPSSFLHAMPDDPAFVRSLEYAQDQHRAILEAIGAREGARAEAIAREHARLARRNLELALAQGGARVPSLALVVDPPAERG